MFKDLPEGQTQFDKNEPLYSHNDLRKAILEERNACADLCVSLRNHHKLSAIVMANRIRERNDET